MDNVWTLTSVSVMWGTLAKAVTLPTQQTTIQARFAMEHTRMTHLFAMDMEHVLQTKPAIVHICTKGSIVNTRLYFALEFRMIHCQCAMDMDSAQVLIPVCVIRCTREVIAVKGNQSALG